MGKKRKRYNPMKEVNRLTGTMAATTIGVGVPYQIANAMPAGIARTQALASLNAPTSLMPSIGVAQAGGTVIGSLKMLDQSYHRKKKR
jgi:hypothetical protein